MILDDVADRSFQSPAVQDEDAHSGGSAFSLFIDRIIIGIIKIGLFTVIPVRVQFFLPPQITLLPREFRPHPERYCFIHFVVQQDHGQDILV